MAVGLRSFFAWAHEQGYIPFNPALGIRGIRRRGTTRTHRRDELTASEVLTVLDTCDESKVGRRDYALLSLMAYAALRQGEIHRADIEDLKTQDRRQVLWVQGKGSPDKDDFVVLSPIAEEAILGTSQTDGGLMLDYLRTRFAIEAVPNSVIVERVTRGLRAAGWDGANGLGG